MDVSHHRQQPEKSTQHILALCRPGNRLNVEGMERKQGGDETAPPDGPSHPPQNHKQ